MPVNSSWDALRSYLQQEPNVRFALVFGSWAKQTAGPDSDLDLALYFGQAPEGIDTLEMINTLSNIANREVDLVVLNRASAFLRHQVVKEGIRFLIKDPIGYRKFREKTMIDYDIYRYLTKAPAA